MAVLSVLAIGIFATFGLALPKYVMRQSARSTSELGDAMAAAMVDDMIDRDEAKIQQVVERIADSSDSIIRALILNSESKVVFSSDSTLLGEVYDTESDPSCTGCHDALDTAPTQRTMVAGKHGGTPFHRNVRVIQNSRQCHACHDADAATNGKLIIDRSLTETRAFTSKMATGMVLVGLGFLALLVPFTAKNVNRYINRILGQERSLESLYVFLKRLSCTIDMRELQRVTLETLYDAMSADAVDLVTAKADGGLRCVTWDSATETVRRKKVDENPKSHVLITRWFADPSIESQLSRDRSEIHLAIPRTGSQPLLIIIRRAGAAFDHDHLMLARMMAEHISVAFQNAQLYTLAITDDLTGLYTRRHFDTCSAVELGRAEEKSADLALLMVDLDDFKAINDSHGHSVGDRVLRTGAWAIRDAVRDTDLVFRYGGDEFTILLPDTAAEEATVVAERVRRAVEGEGIGEADSSVTVSIGVAAYPAHATVLMDLLLAADEALYAAKHAGKNKAVAPAGTGRCEDIDDHQ